MSIGIPIMLLHEALPHTVTVETRSGDTYRGRLIAAEDCMNVQLKDVSLTRRDGRVTALSHVFIRGSKIRFVIVPDVLASAPMFKPAKAGGGLAAGWGGGEDAFDGERRRGGGVPGAGRLSCALLFCCRRGRAAVQCGGVGARRECIIGGVAPRGVDQRAVFG